MANAEQIDPTPVVLTRRDSLKRGGPCQAAEEDITNHGDRGFGRSSQSYVGYNFETFAADSDPVLRTFNLSSPG